eukprot:702998_1
MSKRPIQGQQLLSNGQYPNQAKIVDYNEENSLYKVNYEDGNTQWIDLENPNVQFISQHKAVKVQKPLDGAAPTFTLQTSQAFFNQFFCKDYPQYQAQSSSTTRHMDISPVAIQNNQSRFTRFPTTHGHPPGPNPHPHLNGPPPGPHGQHGPYPPGPHGPHPGPHGPPQSHRTSHGPYPHGPYPQPGPGPNPHPHGGPHGNGNMPPPGTHGYPPPHGHHPPPGPGNMPPHGGPPRGPPNRIPPNPPYGHGHVTSGPPPGPGTHPQPGGYGRDRSNGSQSKNSSSKDKDGIPKTTNEEFVNKVKEIERRIIQHLHQRGYDESHPDYHRYLQKAKELAIQKAGKEREKMLAQQREIAAQQTANQSKGVTRQEYEQYMRYRQEKQRQHAIAEQQRKQRLAEQQAAVRQQQNSSTGTKGGTNDNNKLTSPSKSSGSVKGLIVLRGLPGSGKTTLAKKLAQRSKNARICTEDRYHWSGKEDGVGEYKFQ